MSTGLVLCRDRSDNIVRSMRGLGHDVDLFVPELNFVFGEADLVGKAAVFSLARLRQEVYGLKPDPRLFRRRAPVTRTSCLACARSKTS